MFCECNINVYVCLSPSGWWDDFQDDRQACVTPGLCTSVTYKHTHIHPHKRLLLVRPQQGQRVSTFHSCYHDNLHANNTVWLFNPLTRSWWRHFLQHVHTHAHMSTQTQTHSQNSINGLIHAGSRPMEGYGQQMTSNTMISLCVFTQAVI